MRVLLALFAVALLGVDLGACGETGKASRTDSNAAVTATGSAAPASTGASPRTTKGRNPVPYETVGVAGSAADRQAITAMVKRYYAAMAANDGATACSLLNRSLANALPEDYGNKFDPPYMRGSTCSVVLSKMFMHRHGHPTSDVSGMEVTGVRVVNGIAAVALLRSPTMPLGETSLRREDGRWTMDQMLGGPLG
jgi:hypothetical protein